RPGAIDLSALNRPAPAAASPTGAAPGAPASVGAPAASSSAYALHADEQNFQSILEASVTAPVLLVFHSVTRMAESGQLARDMETLADEFEGRFLVGLVDVDA